MYFNIEGQKEVTYDAIVVGSGISGGWAAKELCEKGLKTLVLETTCSNAFCRCPRASLAPGRGWCRN